MLMIGFEVLGLSFALRWSIVTEVEHDSNAWNRNVVVLVRNPRVGRTAGHDLCTHPGCAA